MIPHQTIEQIYSTAKIEEVIADYVSLRRRGANLWGNCPFHDEKTPSFSVSPAKGIFKCFGCGKAGNAVNFVMEIEHTSYPEALKQIAKKYNITIQEEKLTEQQLQQQNLRESLFMLNQWANQWFQNQLLNTPEGQAIGLQYFYQRGLQDDTIRRFQLGYSPAKNKLYYDAKKAGYSEQLLLQAGLCGQSINDNNQDNTNKQFYDRFRDRVIFPIFTISGKTVAFAGRILKTKEHTGKYVNSPESEIYSKQNELYGLFQAKADIAKQQMCYLVEGQLDVISLSQAGIRNVVSSGGTALTQKQVILLHRLTENVTILYDADPAGIHATLRAIDMMLQQGLNIKVILLPQGDDPDSLAKKLNADQLKLFLQQSTQDPIIFKTNLLLKEAQNDPIKISQTATQVLQTIALIPDPITREVYAKDCAQLLNINQQTIIKEIQKIRKNNNNQNNPNNNITNPTDTPTTTTDNNIATDNDNILNQQPPKLQQNILNLLQVLIKYGNYPLFTMPDSTICSVAQYIISELDNDNITFQDPNQQLIIDLYKSQLKQDNFNPEKFFVFNQNPQIAQLASQLISEPYQLSKIYTRHSISENITATSQLPTDADRLPDLIPQLIFELKDTLITQQISFLQTALLHASQNNQTQQETQLLQQINQLQSIRKQINNSPYLGKRVII